MLELPSSTAFNRRIPKQKFYENLSVTPEIKRIFIEQISVIYWRNKIAATTMNIGAGENVTELEVFELRLNQQGLDTRVLQLIDREIPYHILFLLSFNGLYQAWIGYKEQSHTKQGVFKVNSYYHTDWVKPDQLNLKLDGLNVDAVYDNFIRQIAGERLLSAIENTGKTTIDLKEAIERDEKRQKLMNQIAVLETKINREKQFNIRVQLNGELKKLKQELSQLK
ncbi:DUF4391 domain-containing protein [Ruminiclostridium herbifermentans]|uniref:DUF4391 domain-containing protein n=1 Tax=Ruminiclostridium herbifermentans TaxID=2488810 RepID=A0A4U7J6I6_9FIRM|nr:DUF4391 domain-containing protein [Ruminiclostridium herbifermentans]QNU67938.1 DUF4391 domain-containing protein [Ruminiclostridium herbifermentans]